MLLAMTRNRLTVTASPSTLLRAVSLSNGEARQSSYSRCCRRCSACDTLNGFHAGSTDSLCLSGAGTCSICGRGLTQLQLYTIVFSGIVLPSVLHCVILFRAYDFGGRDGRAGLGSLNPRKEWLA